MRRSNNAENPNNRPLKTKVHPTRIIAYLVQLGITIFMFNFLRNHFMMLVFSIMVAAPILDAVAFFIIFRAIDIRLTAPERDVSRFNIGFLKLELTNKSLMVSYDLNARLQAENTFYSDTNSIIISLPCAARTTYEKQIPVKYSMNGIYKYSITEITVRDFLGFVSLRKKVDTSAEVNVYPESQISKMLNMTDMSRGMTESEETVKRGHDFSDVSDVREYIPGDKLMSIHWKLSAKRDILMVKDRVTMSDQQMIILTELAGKAEEVDDVITLSYGIVEKLVREQTYVRLMWWSDANYQFEERQIMNLENLKEAFADMYYENIYYDTEKTKTYMRSIKPELKAYINVCMKDGQPDAVIIEQD